MYELTCPECQTANSVTPAKAGGEIACAQCGTSVAVPKLGELKQLPPMATTGEKTQPKDDVHGLSGGRSMAFAAVAALSLLCFLGAAFCGVNWATIEVPITTETHLADLKRSYDLSSSAKLIREYEDITQYGVDIPQPYPYRNIELRKQAWRDKTDCLWWCWNASRRREHLCRTTPTLAPLACARLSHRRRRPSRFGITTKFSSISIIGQSTEIGHLVKSSRFGSYSVQTGKPTDLTQHSRPLRSPPSQSGSNRSRCVERLG